MSNAISYPQFAPMGKSRNSRKGLGCKLVALRIAGKEQKKRRARNWAKAPRGKGALSEAPRAALRLFRKADAQREAKTSHSH